MNAQAETSSVSPPVADQDGAKQAPPKILGEAAKRRLTLEKYLRERRRRPSHVFVTEDAHRAVEIKSLTLDMAGAGSRPFTHRGSDADYGVIDQIFVNEDYSPDHLVSRSADLRRSYYEILKAGKIPLIVDAGANIGASALYFLHQYPKSQITAIEPDHGNCDLFLKNTAGLNVDLHQAAIGARAGHVNLFDPGEGEWAFRTLPDPKGKIPVVAMNDLVESKLTEGYAPLIVKIDIEGAEDTLFDEPNEWVNLFPVLIIELHDWLLPKKRTSQGFLKCIANLDRDFIYANENIFSIRN